MSFNISNNFYINDRSKMNKIKSVYIKPLQTFIKLGWKVKVLKKPGIEVARWMADECTKLGATYIKLGQFISSRGDLFGEDIANQFSKLRDTVPPLSDSELDHILQNYIDRSKYVEVDTTPLATASIGQVHKAIIARNTKKHRVVIKIKRPMVEQDINDNIQFIISLLNFFKAFKLDNAQDSIDLVEDFKKTVLKEVDFKNEAKNIVLFKEISKNHPVMLIPKFVPSLSSQYIITMQYMPSISLNNYKGNKKQLAKTLIKTFIEQLVKTGTIHGDPHAGNLGVTKSGKIVLYDFGNIIQVSYQERQYFKELINYLLMGNKPAVMATLEKLNIQITDKEVMNKYIDGYMAYLRTLNIIEISKLMNSSNVKMPFKLTGTFFRLVRVFGILEGVCKELDPNFTYTDVLQEFSTDVMFDREFLIYKTSTDIASILSYMVVLMDNTKSSSK